jgi:oligosaccharide repeat unit polymerase
MIDFSYLALLLFGFFLFLFVSLRYNDFFNPLAVGTLIWFSASSISVYPGFHDSSVQDSISLQTIIVIFISGLFFCFPAIILKKNFIKNVRRNFQVRDVIFGVGYRSVVGLTSLLTILAFFIRFHDQLSGPALFSTSGGSDLKANVPDAIPVLHYFDYLTPVVALVLVYEWMFDRFISSRRKIVIFLYIIFVLISLIVYKVSRGELFVLFLGSLYLYYVKGVALGSRRLLSTFLLSSSLVFVIALIGLYRISNNSRVSTQFGADVWPFLSQVYTYLAFNFQNLNQLVVNENPYTYFWATWRFILRYFYFGDFKSDLNIVDYETIFFNAKTFVYYFYHDLGLLGVALYSFFIGCFVHFFYILAMRDPRFFIILASLQKPVFFLFFGNYFFGEFIMIFGLFFSLLVVVTIRRRVRLNTP